MNEPENGEDLIDGSGRNPTQQRIDEGGPRLSEVIPEDPDRGGDQEDEQEGGSGSDDGGDGSENM